MNVRAANRCGAGAMAGSKAKGNVVNRLIFFYRIRLTCIRAHDTILSMETTRKAFGYLRVSGRDQVDGDGFTRQRAEISKWVAANGVQIVKWFEEKGITGTADAIDRPAWQDLMVALMSNGTTMVVVEKLDRLARDPIVQEQLLLSLRKQGFELVSALEPELTHDDPSREMMRFIFGAVSRYDKKMIVLKLKAARQRKRIQTGRCEGRKPYGARDGEQVVIDRILNLRTFGSNYEQIARELNATGTMSRSGKPWRPATIRRILLAQ